MGKTKTIGVNEAARIKQCSRQAIHYAIQSGRLKATPETASTVIWRICPKSLAQLKINPKMQTGGRNGRVTNGRKDGGR